MKEENVTEFRRDTVMYIHVVRVACTPLLTGIISLREDKRCCWIEIDEHLA